MKRKKWSEQEELTLLTKYLELSTSGALSKLKTREKKFRPIADHVSTLHHLQDPVRFPFRWTWRDVSIKVQNMRNQYVGVKQKIRAGDGEFNWSDGENHWENFMKYKEVFGDVELEVKEKEKKVGCSKGGDFLGFMDDCEGFEDEDEDDDGGVEIDGDDDGIDGEEGADGDLGGGGDGELGGEKGECEDDGMNGETVGVKRRKLRKGIGSSLRKRQLGELGKQVLGLRDVMLRREETRREREFCRERCLFEREKKRKEVEFRWELEGNERLEIIEKRELELAEREARWARRESERWVRLEDAFEERRRRMRVEEKREEEEMEWRERMVCLQMEHEKAMMQMHADACQNQLQILGVMARVVCQFFGSASDALSGGISGLHPQVLQNLQHPSGLDDGVKPDGNSPSEFL